MYTCCRQPVRLMQEAEIYFLVWSSSFVLLGSLAFEHLSHMWLTSCVLCIRTFLSEPPVPSVPQLSLSSGLFISFYFFLFFSRSQRQKTFEVDDTQWRLKKKTAKPIEVGFYSCLNQFCLPLAPLPLTPSQCDKGTWPEPTEV